MLLPPWLFFWLGCPKVGGLGRRRQVWDLNLGRQTGKMSTLAPFNEDATLDQNYRQGLQGAPQVLWKGGIECTVKCLEDITKGLVSVGAVRARALTDFGKL